MGLLLVGIGLHSVWGGSTPSEIETDFSIFLRVWHAWDVPNMDLNLTSTATQSPSDQTDAYVVYWNVRGYKIDEVSGVALDSNNPDWTEDTTYRDIGTVFDINSLNFVIFELWDADIGIDQLIARFNISDLVRAQFADMVAQKESLRIYTDTIGDFGVNGTGASCNFTAQLYYKEVVDGRSISMGILIPSSILAIIISLFDFKITGKRGRSNTEITIDVIANVIFMVIGGLFTYVLYAIISALYYLSYFGQPISRKIWSLSIMSLVPFGRYYRETDFEGDDDVEEDDDLKFENMGTEHQIYLVCGGFLLPVAHLFFGCVCLVSLIGIPVAAKHFASSREMISPFNKVIEMTVRNLSTKVEKKKKLKIELGSPGTHNSFQQEASRPGHSVSRIGVDSPSHRTMNTDTRKGASFNLPEDSRQISMNSVADSTEMDREGNVIRQVKEQNSYTTQMSVSKLDENEAR
jgi:uncharacterized membrane protein YccF (DUF307 family)